MNVKKTITNMIVILPILAQYKSGVQGFSLGDVFLILAVILATIDFVYKNKKVQLNKITSNPFFWFVIYILFNALVTLLVVKHISVFDISTRSFRFLFYIISGVFILPNYFDFKIFKSTYGKIVIVSAIFLVFQYLVYQGFNIAIFGVYKPLISRFDVLDIDSLLESYKYLYRPSSFFEEPGYYAQFVLPFLALEMFSFNLRTRSKYMSIILVYLSLILSTSGQGILIGVFILALLYVKTIKRMNMKKLALILTSVPIVFYLSGTDLMNKSLDRLFTGEWASSNARIFRGFDIYSQISLPFKIFGVGYGNIGTYLGVHNIFSVYDRNNNISEYMNSIAYILVNTGLIGIVLLICIYIYLINKTSNEFRVCVYILFILSMVSTHFLYINSVFYLLIITSGFEYKNSGRSKW